MADTKTQETYDGHNKTRVAIPEEVLARYNPEDGDELDITVKDGYIYIEPVAVYPKETVDKWIKESDEVYKEIESGERRPFTNVDDLISDLREKCQEAASDVCA